MALGYPSPFRDRGCLIWRGGGLGSVSDSEKARKGLVFLSSFRVPSESLNRLGRDSEGSARGSQGGRNRGRGFGIWDSNQRCRPLPAPQLAVTPGCAGPRRPGGLGRGRPAAVLGDALQPRLACRRRRRVRGRSCRRSAQVRRETRRSETRRRETRTISARNSDGRL